MGREQDLLDEGLGLKCIQCTIPHFTIEQDVKRWICEGPTLFLLFGGYHATISKRGSYLWNPTNCFQWLLLSCLRGLQSLLCSELTSSQVSIRFKYWQHSSVWDLVVNSTMQGNMKSIFCWFLTGLGMSTVILLQKPQKTDALLLRMPTCVEVRPGSDSVIRLEVVEA